MTKKHFINITAAFGLAVLCASCSYKKNDTAYDESTYGKNNPKAIHQAGVNAIGTGFAGDGANSVQTAGFWDESNINGRSFSGVDAVQAQNVFYFDFDKSIVRNNSYDDLQAHAEYLMINAGKKVHVIGHADERGTPEYNLALGEQRAKAIADVLLLQGVKKEQLVITSYGEESPIALGHDETAWQQNRRAELIY